MRDFKSKSVRKANTYFNKSWLNGFNAPLNGAYVNFSKFLCKQFFKNIKFRKYQTKKRQRKSGIVIGENVCLEDNDLPKIIKYMLDNENNNIKNAVHKCKYNDETNFMEKSASQISDLYQQASNEKYSPEKLEIGNRAYSYLIESKYLDDDIENLTSSIYDFDITGLFVLLFAFPQIKEDLTISNTYI